MPCLFSGVWHSRPAGNNSSFNYFRSWCFRKFYQQLWDSSGTDPFYIWYSTTDIGVPAGQGTVNLTVEVCIDNEAGIYPGPTLDCL